MKAWTVVTVALLATAAGAFAWMQSPAGKRARLLRIAAAEIGNSDGQKYWTEVLGRPRALPTDYCGAFALWALRRALGVDWRWVESKGFLGRLPRTEDPRPGDMGYADNGYNHHGIIESVNPDGTITSIDGNSWFGQVRRRTRPRSFWSAFHSIDPLL